MEIEVCKLVPEIHFYDCVRGKGIIFSSLTPVPS
jgi:hypothetical protein